MEIFCFTEYKHMQLIIYNNNDNNYNNDNNNNSKNKWKIINSSSFLSRFHYTK